MIQNKLISGSTFNSTNWPKEQKVNNSNIKLIPHIKDPQLKLLSQRSDNIVKKTVKNLGDETEIQGKQEERPFHRLKQQDAQNPPHLPASVSL